MKKTSMIVAALAVAAGTMSAGQAQAWCKAFPRQATAFGPTAAGALSQAGVKWQIKVANMDGPAWANWFAAANRNPVCTPAGWGKWKCVARARPCN